MARGERPFSEPMRPPSAAPPAFGRQRRATGDSPTAWDGGWGGVRARIFSVLLYWALTPNFRPDPNFEVIQNLSTPELAYCIAVLLFTFALRGSLGFGGAVGLPLLALVLPVKILARLELGRHRLLRRDHLPRPQGHRQARVPAPPARLRR